MTQTELDERREPAAAATAASVAGRGIGRAGRWAVVASLATSAVVVARSAFTIDGRLTFVLFDDAMISLTYARNLARGSGLVWNQGGEHVEGYTNFLWTLWLAVVHGAGVPAPLTSLVVMLSGAALLAVAVVATGRIARSVSSEPVVSGIAMWMVALSPPLVFWTLRGMEVGLLAAILTGATLVTLRLRELVTHIRLVTLGGLLCAGVLTRPDFVVFAGVVALFATWWAASEDRARVGATTFGAILVTVAAHTAFRLAYYGSATPNTYTLKIGGVDLAERIDRGLSVMVDVVGIELLVPLLIVAVGFALERRAPTPIEQLAGALVVSSFGYVAWTGGDAWEWMTMPNRYIAPTVPQLALLTALAAAKVGRAFAPVWTRAPAVLGAGLLLLIAAMEDPATDGGRDLASGRYLIGGSVAALAGVVALTLVIAARGRGTTHRTALVGVVAVAAVFAMPAYHWVRINSPYLDVDQHNARLGATLGHVTSDDASIAVVSAGAIPYFADRPAVDLLGKSDETIAKLEPKAIPFIPGHMKWDLGWSVGTLQPDIVTGYRGARDGARDTLASLGYEQVHGTVYVKTASAQVDVTALRASLEADPAELFPASRG